MYEVSTVFNEAMDNYHIGTMFTFAYSTVTDQQDRMKSPTFGFSRHEEWDSSLWLLSIENPNYPLLLM